MVIWGGVTIMFGLIIVSNASTVIAGFINPEYWVLQKILSH